MTALPPKRIPLVVTASNRDQTTSFDARVVNGYAEKSPDGELWLYKRPGFLTTTQLGAGVGQGVYQWQGYLMAIVAGTLFKDGVSVATGMNTAGGIYTFQGNMNVVPQLLIFNSQAAYYYSVSGGLVSLPLNPTYNIIYGNPVITITNGSPTITGLYSYETALVNPGDSFVFMYGFNPVTPFPNATVATVGSTTITMNSNATASYGGSITIYGTPGASFPSNVGPGAVFLDATIYVMDNQGNIRGSGLNSVASTAWATLNSLQAQIEPDQGVAIAKQLVYVVTFKQWSTQIYYDTATGQIPALGQVQGQQLAIGCASGRSVQEMDGILYWISATRTGGVAVHKLDQLIPKQISTPAVDRLLQTMDYTIIYSWTAKIGGHKFYGITSKVSNLTLVFDDMTGEWAQWTDPYGNYVPVIASTYTVARQPLLQDELDGHLYTLSLTAYNDDSAVFPVDIYTPNFDGEVKVRKTVNKLYVIADQTVGSSVAIRTSDDDYKTWSNPVQVDLGLDSPCIDNMGTFKRRAHHIRHACNTPFRIKAIELHALLGTL